MGMSSEKNLWSAGVLVLIGLLFLWLRWEGLVDHCLWFDEIYSAHAASMPLREMMPFIARDLVHPPFFYVLLGGWVSVFGDSQLALRSFPFVVSLLSLAAAFFLMRQLRIGSTGMVAGILFIAVNGLLIKYSQEVRMYSLVVTLSLFSAFLFERFFRMGKGIVALTVINGLLVATHYFGFILIVSQIAVVLVWQRIKIRPIVFAGGISMMPVAVWIGYVLSFSRESEALGQNIGWIPAPGLFTVLNSIFDFTEPVYFDAGTSDLPTNPIFSIPMLLLLIVAVAFAVREGGVKAIRSGEGLFPHFAVATFGFLIVLVLSLILPYSIWGSRHLLVLFGPFLAVIAIALSSSIWNHLKAIPLATISSIALMAVVFGVLQPRETRHIWCAWEKFAVFLKERPNLNEPIYFVDDLAAYHFWYFSRRSQEERPILLLRNGKIRPADDDYFLPRGFQGVTRTDRIDASRPFLIGFVAKKWDEDQYPLKELRSSACNPETIEIFEANQTKAFLVRCG